MKSKRAERHIDDYEVTDDIFDIYVTKETAVQAVELAEEDARERAGKAHCSTCLDNRYPRGCQFQNRLDCSHLTNFIKNYDNE